MQVTPSRSEDTAQPRRRRSARALLLRPDRSVLLIRFEVSRAGGTHSFWATPGGGVLPGETEDAAVLREVGEELGLSVPLTGPVHRGVSRFDHDGLPVEQDDAYYLGFPWFQEPTLASADPGERAAMREYRWWTLGELDRTGEPVFPEDLAAIVRAIPSSRLLP